MVMPASFASVHQQLNGIKSSLNTNQLSQLAVTLDGMINTMNSMNEKMNGMMREIGKLRYPVTLQKIL